MPVTPDEQPRRSGQSTDIAVHERSVAQLASRGVTTLNTHRCLSEHARQQLETEGE